MNIAENKNSLTALTESCPYQNLGKMNGHYLYVGHSIALCKECLKTRRNERINNEFKDKCLGRKIKKDDIDVV
jgi:hypothetical protein